MEEAKLDTKLSRRSEYYNLDNTGIFPEVNEDSQLVNTETSVSFEKNYNYKIVNIVIDNKQETSFDRAMKKNQTIKHLRFITLSYKRKEG